MRIGFHPTASHHAEGGAVKNYSELTELLSTAPSRGHRPVHHNFWRLLRESPADQASFVNRLGPDDVVVANVGPHAHFYHWLRERYGGDYRIIRDVRTSSWAGFWLQEFLAGPMTREGDLVVFPSEFCRRHVMRLFPRSLSTQNTAVCYPMDAHLPREVARDRRSGLRIGALGRISDDKNAHQVLEVFAALRREAGSAATLEIAGPIDPRSSLPSERALMLAAADHGIPEDAIRWWGDLPYDRIWEFLARLDVLFFPSMANVESLGRVVIEAARAQVPVVSAEYAAAPELLPANNLVRSRYRIREALPTNDLFSFGTVDEADAVAKLLNPALDEDVSRRPVFREAAFWDLLEGRLMPTPSRPLSPVVEAFSSAVAVNPSLETDLEASVDRCTELLGLWQSMRVTGDQVVLGNARRLCRKAGFDPIIELQPSDEARRLLQPAPHGKRDESIMFGNVLRETRNRNR